MNECILVRTLAKRSSRVLEDGPWNRDYTAPRLEKNEGCWSAPALREAVQEAMRIRETVSTTLEYLCPLSVSH